MRRASWVRVGLLACVVAASCGGGGVPAKDGGIGGVGGGGGGAAGTGGRAGGGGGGAAGMAGMGGTGGIAGGGPATVACPECPFVILPVAARDVVYSATRGRVYASVAGEAAVYANTIVVVDPATSAVVEAIPIGSNPGALALSEDESTLWVGIDGAYALRKLTLSATPPVVGPLRRLPMADDTQYFVPKVMVPLPGAPLSVAMLSWDRLSVTQAHVFDDGVARPLNVKGGVPTADFIVGGPPGFVYGYQRTPPGDLFVFAISTSGITQTGVVGEFAGFPTSAVYARGNLIFGSGETFDVSNPAAPVMAAGSLPVGGAVALRDPETLLALSVDRFTNPQVYMGALHALAIDSRTEIASVPLPAALAPSPNASYSHLVYAGGDAVAFVFWDHVAVPSEPRLVVLHHPRIASPTGGAGGAAGGGIGGTGGGGGAGGSGAGGSGAGGGAGATGDACPGCTFATVANAHGSHMAFDASRNLVYVTADAFAKTNANTIVTVDVATAAVTSAVPVGNNPQPLALADDGSLLWVGLAGSRQVRRLTPGRTPVAGAAYPLPMLAPVTDDPVPTSIAVLPGAPASIAVSVEGFMFAERAALILDEGAPRASFTQPPPVDVSLLTNGPPGTLLGIGAPDQFVVLRLGAAGATVSSHRGLVTGSFQLSLAYRGGMAYASQGEVVDVTSPDAPVRAGRFGFYSCAQTFRSANRVLMLCRDRVNGRGTKLRVMDTATFAQVASVTLPAALEPIEWLDIAYVGGDAVALLAPDEPLRIMRAPIVGNPP